jgi:heptosyltransferase I
LLDRYVGIPAVRALSLLQINRSAGDLRDPRRIAFLQTAAIGDTVLSSAITRSIQKAYPDARLTFFTGSSNYEIACLIPRIDRVVKLPVKRPLEAVRLIREAGTFDLWVDFGPWPRLNALWTFFAHAGLKVGFKTTGQYRHYIYDRVALHSDEIHELENYRRLLTAVRIPVGDSRPELVHDPIPLVQNRIAVHLFPGGSMSYLKEWPEDKWVLLLDALADRGMEIYLTGTGVDRERALRVQERVRKRNAVRVVAGEQSIKEVIQLLMSSRLVISVDTGIMHVASALGTDLISLHGPTAPSRWGPLNTNSVAIRSSRHCKPCISLGFDSACNDPRCMDAISVEEVLSAVDALLKRPAGPVRPERG